MADLSFIVDYRQIKAANKELEKIGPTAQKAASSFESAFSKNLTSVTKQIAFSKRLEAQKAKESKAISDAAKRVAAEEERLKGKFVQGYTAMNLYSKELNDLAIARKRDIISAQQQRDMVAQLNKDFAGGSGIFATYANAMGKSSNRMGVAMQQTGYQVGDFLVQVQSGTNPMVAFGQQATQLVGILPMMASALGMTTIAAIGLSTVLGIGIPLVTAIGAAIMRTRDSKGSLSEVEDAMKSLKEETRGVVEEMQMLNRGLESLAQNSVVNQIELLKTQLEDLNLEAANADVEAYGFITERIRAKEEEIRKLEEELKLSQEANSQAREREEAEKSRQRDQEQRLLAIKTAASNLADQMERAARASMDFLSSLRSSTNLTGLQAEVAALEGGRSPAQAAAERVRAERRADPAYQAILSGGSTTDIAQADALIEAEARRVERQAALNSRRSSLLSQGGSSASGSSENTPYLKQLMAEAEYKNRLVGISEEQARREEILFELSNRKETATEAEIQQIIELEEKTRRLTDAEQRRTAMMNMVEGNIESAFMSMTDGSKSVVDAFRGMMRDILLEVYRQQFAKPIAGAIGSAIFGSANGNVFSSGSHVKAYANGGVVGSPTYFPMKGGKTGLMGEAGPEAIMPLKRGANGKLGVQMEGGGGTVVVNQSFNFSANGDDSVKRIIAQAAPQIAQMTKKSIIDDRRRGGSTKAAFG